MPATPCSTMQATQTDCWSSVNRFDRNSSKYLAVVWQALAVAAVTGAGRWGRRRERVGGGGGKGGNDMPTKDHGPSIKDDKQYEALRDEGMSKEKAARIANASANEGRSK